MNAHVPNPARIAERASQLMAEAEASGQRMDVAEAADLACAELYPNYYASRQTQAKVAKNAAAVRARAVGAAARDEADEIRAARDGN